MKAARFRRYGVSASARRPDRGEETARCAVASSMLPACIASASVSASGCSFLAPVVVALASTRVCHAQTRFNAASSGSIIVMPNVAAIRSATRAPTSPLSVPAAPIRPNVRLAVCGSKCSVTISQNPEPSIGPRPEICRYSAWAASFGASGSSTQSARNRAALMANAIGMSVPGAMRRTPRELNATRRIENAAVATTIAGRAVTSRLARKRVSRAALPATNCAPTAPAHTIAVVTAGAGCAFGNSMGPANHNQRCAFSVSGSIVSERRAELQEELPALAAAGAEIDPGEGLLVGVDAHAESIPCLQVSRVDVLPVLGDLAAIDKRRHADPLHHGVRIFGRHPQRVLLAEAELVE